MGGNDFSPVRVPDVLVVEDNRVNSLLVIETLLPFYPEGMEDAVCENFPEFQQGFARFRQKKRRTLLLVLDGNFPLVKGGPPIEGAYTRVLQEVSSAVNTLAGEFRVAILPYSSDERTNISGNPLVKENPHIHVLTGGKPFYPQEALEGLRTLEQVPGFYR